MKKNYSQKFFKQTANKITVMQKSLVQQNRVCQSPTKKAFSRKPANSYIPLTRKKHGESLMNIESTMQQSQFSQLVQKSKQLKFVSTRSQTSLNSSQISKSSASLSISNSKNQQIDEQQQYSTFLPSQSISPQKHSTQQRQLFRRKTVLNTRTPIINKKKPNQKSFQQQNNTGSKISISNKNKTLNNTESQKQTKLQSTQFSDMSKSCVSPPSTSVIKCNFVRNQKHSSKDSLRKSNSSNSIKKKQECGSTCKECQLTFKEIKQANSKIERLERILKNKDQEIGNLNKKIAEIDKKSKEFEKKIKDFQKFQYPTKINMLEQQLKSSEEQCTRLKDSLSKALQELKYKNVQNSTLKKIQAQCQGLQRKCQMLVSQRNQLRDQVSNKKIPNKSSYIHYPSASRQSKMNNIPMKIHHNQQNDRTTYTSRQEQQFDDSQQTFSTTGFKKKKNNLNSQFYQESSQSEIISLSEESNF